MMEGLKQDVRYAMRALRRGPGFTLVAILVLGAGIGATATIFSGVHAVLLAPLPFDEPDRLVALWERNPDFGWEQVDAAPANVLDWRERVEAFADVAAYRGNSLAGATWVRDGEPRRLAVAQVTGNFFDVLGLRPHLGSWPDFEDTWGGGEPWVVVSHRLWQESFGGDPDVVGRTLELEGIAARIRAVAPPGVRFPADDTELWAPYGWSRDAVDQAWFRRAHFVQPIARLSDGASLEQARAQLDAVALQLQDEYPSLNANMFAGFTPLRTYLVGDLRRPLRTLMAGVGILMLLACVNVGNLFFVRAVGRTGEISLRRAIGAGSGRIVRQLLAEAGLVGLGGGLLGVALSVVGIRILDALRPLGIAGATGVALDGPVLGFAIGVSALSVLVFGLAPALRVAGGALPAGLAGGRGSAGGGPGVRRRFTRGLVPVQTALAVILVLAAALVTRSFVRLQAEDAGIDPDGVWTFSVAVPDARYPDRDAVLGFYDRLIESVEAMPGVEGAAVTGGVPLTFSGWTSQLVARDWDPGRVAFEVRHRASTPGYFDVMGVPLLAGRPFQPGDGLEPPYVAIVNEAFVDVHFGGGPAVGRQVTFDREPDENSVWRTIVGVVGNERQATLSQPPDPEVWEPFPQDWGAARSIVLRTAGDPATLRESLVAALAGVDPNVPLGRLRSMNEVVRLASADARFLSVLFGLFAGLALALAALGIYGVTAQVVRHRVPEFGVRMALGADGSAVVRMVLGRTLRLAGAGVGVGSIVALAGAGVMQSLLYSTAARDPVAFSMAPLLLLAVALVAAWWPATRAARVDPVRSLRAE
jgi:predicted permease